MRLRSLMQPDSWLTKWWPSSSASAYLVASLLVSLAFLIRFLVASVLPHPSPYLLCGLAVVAAALHGGKGPGLFATAISAAAGWFSFVQPRLTPPELSDAVQLISFLLVGLAATFLSDRLHAAKRSAEVSAARNTDILERYRYNLEAANAVTFDWNIATGEVLWSDNAESFRGQAAGTFDGTLEGVLKHIHPEDREMVRRNIRAAVEGAGNYQVDCRRVLPDGTVGWMESKGRVVCDERTGQPVRMMGICIDATERKRNELARLQLAAIVDSSNDAVISADMNGIVLTWNAAAERMYGYSAAEIKGSEITRLFAAGCAAKKAEVLRTLTGGEHVQHFEAHCIHKSGRPILVSLTISPIRDSTGATSIASLIVRDITEHKALEEQLRQTAKLESLGVLAGGIAHDFNNLLVGILGNASLVRDAMPAASAMRPMLDDVIKASQRAASLTHQLLAYSGKGKFVIQPVDLSELARDMVSLIQSSIPRSVRLQLDLAANLPAVTADATQMQQLIMNLVINGAEAIGERPGAVTVTTSVQQLDERAVSDMRSSGEIEPGTYVSLEVQDNGAGMDEATIERIFDPFFTTKFTGRGLGLSATLGIVRGHKGSIRVESRPGEGSRFTVLLPAAREQARTASVPEDTQQDYTGSGAVLVVDDEELVRRAAAAALEHCGYTVITAGDGRVAAELFRKFSSRIVLVVLDLSMPVMNGEECLRIINDIRPDVPVILSSGFSEADTVRRFGASRFAGFLQKPYTAAHLAEMAKAAVKGAEEKTVHNSA
jgi:PAS domain S-box-containing protein